MARARERRSAAPSMGGRVAMTDLSQPANVAPPVSYAPVDLYAVREYGYKTGENGSQTLANIECWYQGNFVGYINFYPSDSVPESTITLSAAFLNAPAEFKSMFLPEHRLNYPIERLAEILQTFRTEADVIIGVDTVQKAAVVRYGYVAPAHK